MLISHTRAPVPCAVLQGMVLLLKWCGLSALALVAAASFCDLNDQWATKFEEEFTGDALDPSVWNVVNASDPGSCREAWCDPENVIVGNGTLTLVSKAENKYGHNFTSGAVNTQWKAAWADTPRYRLCVSAKLPGGGGGGAGTGIWPAHWMMPNDHSCWPDEGT